MLCAGTCDANDAVHLTLVQPGAEKPQTLSTFHPQFTYPIFGDEETIFGYKGLIIRLRFAAHDLRPHVHISYDEKFKAVADAAPVDLNKTLKDWIPGCMCVPSFVRPSPRAVIGISDDLWLAAAFTSLSDYEKAIQNDENAKDFVPPGKLVHSYTTKGRNYEIWSGSLADPAVRALLARAQVFVSFFIEAGTPLELDDPEWTLERWTVYFM